MGVMPVRKLLISISFPVMISMLIQALYNIVDSVFVAQISENALTAVSLAFPVQNLIISVGVGTGVGINALLSRKLGEKRYEDANATAENGILISLLSGVVFAVFGLLFSETFFRAFTDNAEVIEMGTQYLTVCTVFSFGCFMQFATERIMQATGVTIYNMITQGTGAIINIILDPIFIFGLFGVPKMGVRGAAIATVIGQIVAMTMGLYFNAKKNHDVHMSLRHFRPSRRIIGEIYKVGLPSIIMQSIGTLMTVGMNKILIMVNATAVPVFGVYFKLQSFVFMPVFGLTNGMVPIVAYNYGAQKKERISQAVRYAMIYAVGIMIVGMVIFMLFAEPLLMMFKASPEMLRIGVPALRIISLSFAFAGVSIVLSSAFQALGNGMLSLIMSVLRQLVVILPVAYLLAKLVGVNAVWFAFPAAEVLASTLAVLMYRYVYNSKIKLLGEQT